ncbi:MAG: transporter substrate-binding domain-containing protein [Actinomycetota bacterium]|nr:transporter substrate-binding domain-containing protein [Actinomycetota bacterium]
MLLRVICAAVASLALAATGCGSEGGDRARELGGQRHGPGSGDPSTDKLAQILARGTLVLFTDPAYPPQSFEVEGAKRPASTKCADNEQTAPDISGYDAETGKLVAEALGVEPCFVTPSWTEVTAGNWGDRWDLAYGSGAIEFSRMEALYMTQPYYSTPTNFFVPRSSPAKTPADLSGSGSARAQASRCASRSRVASSSADPPPAGRQRHGVAPAGDPSAPLRRPRSVVSGLVHPRGASTGSNPGSKARASEHN